MGLRCLLGHDFTEPSTEREREERGDEVITTIREVKECRRCGETQVVSESTEVTSMGGSGGDAGSWQAGANATAAEASSGGDAAGGAETVVDEAEGQRAPETANDGFDHPRGDPGDADPSVEDDAEIIRDGPTGGTHQESADQSGNQPSQEAAEPTADDGAPAERGHGEWPDSDRRQSGDAAGRESGESTREWPDPDARSDEAGAGRGGSHDTEDAAASEARSGVASGADRGDADGTTTTADDEDVEFIDAEDGPSTDWPEQEGEDEGFDAEVNDGRPDENVTVDGNLTPRVNPNAEVDDDAEFIEASSNPAESRDRRSPGVGADMGSNGRNGSNTRTNAAESGGASGGSESSGPGRRSSGSSTSTPPEHAKNGSSTGKTGDRSAPSHNVELQTTVDDRSMEYLCPDCGKREPVGASSMRAGDICPECKRGYIEEHEL